MVGQSYKWLVWLVAFSVLAGCVKSDEKDPATTSTGPQPSIDPTPPPSEREGRPNQPNETSPSTYAKQLILNDCVGWTTGPTVVGHENPPYPPGWNANSTVSAIFMHAFECQRMSLGQFERGPIRFVFDVNGHELPAGCQKSISEISELGILSSIWTDDATVGSYLETRLGLPVYISPINSSTESVGGIDLHRWTWGLPGEPPSEITIAASGQQGSGSLPNRLIAFWFLRSGGLGELDTEFEMLGGGDEPTYGTLQPPMLLADGKPFVWPTIWHSGGSMTGALTLYEDLECGTPLP